MSDEPKTEETYETDNDLRWAERSPRPAANLRAGEFCRPEGESII